MADFVAGYISGAVGILLGNPLDVLKTRLQASTPASTTQPPPALGTDVQPQSASRYGQYLRLLSRRDAFRGVAVPVLVRQDSMLREWAVANQYPLSDLRSTQRNSVRNLQSIARPHVSSFYTKQCRKTTERTRGEQQCGQLSHDSISLLGTLRVWMSGWISNVCHLSSDRGHQMSCPSCTSEQ